MVSLGNNPKNTGPRKGPIVTISQAEEKRIAEFIERVRGKSDKQARMIALSELSYIHNRRKKDDEGEKYSAFNNRKLIIGYRNAIREAYGEDSPLLRTLHYSEARTEEYKSHQQETLEARHRGQRPLDAEKYVDAALLLLGNAVKMRWSNPGAIAALCALTGRRPYEVAVTGRFVPDPGNHRQLIFSGQAKTRDDERADTPFPIPILADRELVLEAIEKLRQNIDQALFAPDVDLKKRNSMFTQKYAKEFGIQSKRAFQDEEGNPLKPADLRDAYAIIAYESFAPRNVSAIQFMNDILGHKTEYLQTTLNYMTFYLV